MASWQIGRAGLARVIVAGLMGIFSLAGASYGQAQYEMIHTFDNPHFSEQGSSPYSGVIQGPDGFLYGTTSIGGPSDVGTVYGTVYKVAPDGSGFTVPVLHGFDGLNGSFPYAGVTYANGFLYGTTANGGPDQYGIVFKIAPDGSGFTVLHAFTGTDGAYPNASPILGNDGMLYGTTYSGGPDQYGTVFKIAPDGSRFAVLHAFTGTDGAYPNASLLLGNDGSLYGTTVGDVEHTQGTVFKISPDGSGFTVLHSFNGSDGGGLYAGLTQDPGGFLYGAAYYGNPFYNGVVFKLAPDGSGFTIIHPFVAGEEGSAPNRLLLGRDGMLYGTTVGGGTSFWGTVFKLARDGGGFAILHSFNQSDGSEPHGDIIQDAGGYIYGTTFSGGSNNGGVLFRLPTDSTPPTITITSPENGAVFALNQAVAAHYSCEDPSGVATCSGPVTSGGMINTTSLGPKNFTVTATDSLGNTGSLTHTYTVAYNFSGFFRPVENPPVLNKANGGRAIPMKFSLYGNRGLAILAPDYPASQRITCDTSAPVSELEETDTAGSSGLTYDAGQDQYSYVWKTEKSWANTCRRFVLKLIDGTEHFANFTFK